MPRYRLIIAPEADSGLTKVSHESVFETAHPVKFGECQLVPHSSAGKSSAVIVLAEDLPECEQ